jgi:hypothetical protein
MTTAPRQPLFCAHADVNGDADRCPCRTTLGPRSPRYLSVHGVTVDFQDIGPDAEYGGTVEWPSGSGRRLSRWALRLDELDGLS